MNKKLDIRTIRKRFNELGRPKLFKYEQDYMWKWYRDDLTRVFNLYVRFRDFQGKAKIKCVSCPKMMYIREADACHYISAKHMKYARDERNVNAGCAQCNQFNKEEHILGYGDFIIEKYGIDVYWELRNGRNEIYKDPDIFYLMEKHAHYSDLVKKISNLS